MKLPKLKSVHMVFITIRTLLIALNYHQMPLLLVALMDITVGQIIGRALHKIDVY